MMITISVANLKKFFQKADHIRQKGLLPICDYTLIEVVDKGNVRLTKSSIESWVTMDVLADVSEGQESFCVFTKALTDSIKYATSDKISIKVTGKKVLLDSGADKDTCAWEDAKNFPARQPNDGAKKYSLTEDVLEGLAIAKVHCLEMKDGTNWMSYIHVQNNKKYSIIAATNNDIGYFKKVDDVLPDTIFEAAHVSAISGERFVTYSTTEKYHFFEVESAIYGFLKTEMSVFDLSNLWDRFKEDVLVHVKKSDIVSFAHKATDAASGATGFYMKISDDKDNVDLDYSNPLTNRGVNRKIKVTGKNGVFPTTFVKQKDVPLALSLLPVDELSISKVSGRLLITSEEDNTFKTIIAEVDPKTENK